MAREYFNFSAFDRFHTQGHELRIIDAHDLAQTQDIGPHTNKVVDGTPDDDPNLVGTKHVDTINGYGGLDTLIGKKGNDFLYGGTEDDVLSGGKGDDLLDGGGGGEDFGDWATYASSTAAVTANLTLGTATGQGSDTLVGIENLIGSDHADTLTGHANADGLCTINGGAGADHIYGGASILRADGGSGDDVIAVGSGGSDVLVGGTGNDQLTGFGNLSGGDGDDILDGGRVLIGGAGADIIKLLPGSNELRYALDETGAHTACPESTGAGHDTVYRANFSSITFSLALAESFYAPSHIDPVVTAGHLSQGSFDTNMAAALGATALQANHAVLFEPQAGHGNLGGHIFLVVDINGIAGYDAGEDMVVELKNAHHLNHLDVTDFES